MTDPPGQAKRTDLPKRDLVKTLGVRLKSSDLLPGSASSSDSLSVVRGFLPSKDAR